jgi:hypothetical protein
MNPQSTDRLPYQTDQNIPRIIYRKEFQATTQTTGSGYVEIESTVKADGIIIGAYNCFDLVVKTPDNKIYFSNARSTTSSAAQDLWIRTWLQDTDMTNNNSTATYRYKIRKYGGAVTDSYTCYLVLWSTKMSEYINIFDTTV